jgi:4-hydroxy-tetrahydrodipicolinate synthase
MSSDFFQRGIHPVLYTFFNADGSIDDGALGAEIDWTLAAGAHGLVTHGLASEVAKLDLDERRHVLRRILAHVDDRAPVAVTVSEPSVRGQIAFAREAVAAGASWIIIQPPQVRVGEGVLADFVAAVASEIEVPVAVQSNPANMDVFLSNATLLALHKRCPNITLLKAEGPATSVRELTSQSRMAVFGGRNGLELVSSLQAGAAGNVPAPEFTRELVRIYGLATSQRPGDLDAARREMARVLPAIVFVNHNLLTQVCYGKRVLAWRMGMTDVFDRGPALAPTDFALAELKDLLLLTEEEAGLERVAL